MTDDLAALVDDRGGRGTQQQIEDIDLGTLAASKLVAGYGLDLHGWVITEATGAGVAKVRLRDGNTVQGGVVAPIGLIAAGTSAMWFGGTGIACETGLFLEVVAGSVEATVYVRAPSRRGRR